jgi:hypothetical protein
VRDNLLDDALLLQVGQTSAGNGTVDLHSVDQDRDGDQAVGLDIFVKLVRGGLVEEDGVLGLVLDYNAIQSVMGLYVTAHAVNLVAAQRSRVEVHAPFPFDHFFLAFLGPVFAGAYHNRLACGN